MKRKFSKMWRVAVALVLVLSFGLMAAPASATVTDITYTDLSDLGQRIADDSDPMALFQVDITSDDGSEELSKVRVDFESISGFDQTDLATVSVYEEEALTNLIPGSVTWVGLVATVTFDPVVALDITGVNDFWVAIETSATITDGDEFRATLDTTSLEIDATPAGTTTETTYTITADTEVPEISAVAGSTLGDDTIIVTFSEAVVAATDWPTAFPPDSIESPVGTALVLTLVAGDFAIDATNKILTITLDYANDVDYLVNGDTVAVTPVVDEILDMSGKVVAADQVVSGAISGDSRAPRVAPADIVGTGGDTIVITFSEIVVTALDTDWTDGDEVAQVRSGADAASLQALDLTDATYGMGSSELELTITLDSAHADLVNDNILAFTPATGAISDLAGNLMADTEVVGTTAITGETTPPTIPGAWAFTVGGETYDPAADRPLTDADTLTMTITFDEAMADSPQVSIEDADEVEILAATDMTEGVGDAWSYGFDVPAGHDGTAIITASGTDLAGNELTGAVTDTFTIDNTAPSIPPANITGTGTDTIAIIFSEDTRGDWEATAADSIDKDDFASIKTDGTTLSLDNAVFAYSANTLTITLDEAIDGAYLVSGDTVAVTPATGALTDEAGNALPATEVVGTMAVGETAPAEVWVDDVETDDPWLADQTHFATITEGIAAVAIGGTVNVLPGTYIHGGNEVLPIDVNKAGVTLQSTGTAAETIIDCETNRNGIWITAADVTVDGFTVKDANLAYAIKVSGADAIVKYNEITSATGYPMVYVISGATGTTLSNNTLDVNTTMIVSSPDISNITLSENTFGAGINLQAGTGTLEDIDITGNIIIGSGGVGIKFETGSFDDILLQGNTISQTTLGNAEEGGIAFMNVVNTVTNVTITENDIANNLDAGIRIGEITSWGTGNTINNNNIYGNVGLGLDNKIVAETVIDAESNWWGSAVEAAILTMVSDYVDYSPWLDAAYPHGEPTTTDSFASAIVLATGWNLISLPLIPEDSDIDTVLADLIADATVEQVRTYDQGIWPSWARTGEPPVNLLTDMADGQGFWVQMNAAGYLSVSGYENCAPAPAVPPAYDVVAGWNLIGYKFVMDGDIETYLGSVYLDLQAIYGYHASTESYFIPLIAEGLRPGSGYWIALTEEEGTIYPTWKAPS